MQVYPSQISPGENFDIFYFLRNHTDATPYYVQAVIYDVRTNQVLATAPLASAVTKPHLYAATLQAPVDPVGYGRNIVAIATVYLDSDFTTKSTDYEEQEQYFLIKPAQTFGGGGGIDYRFLRKLMTEVVTDGIGSIKFPKVNIPDMPFDALFGAIGALQREMNRVPKETNDDAPIMAALEAVKAQIAAIHIPEPTPATDLSAVQNMLKTIYETIVATRHELQLMGSELSGSQQADFKNLTTAVLAKIDTAISDTLGNTDLSIPFKEAFKTMRQPAPDPMEKIKSLMA